MKEIVTAFFGGYITPQTVRIELDNLPKGVEDIVNRMEAMLEELKDNSKKARHVLLAQLLFLVLMIAGATTYTIYLFVPALLIWFALLAYSHMLAQQKRHIQGFTDGIVYAFVSTGKMKVKVESVV